MASCYKMLVFFFLWTMAGSYGVAQNVKLSLYYESLCPYCTDFIVNHLAKALFQSDLLSIVDLELVPWGNTEFGPNNTWVCQHGPEECMIDTVEACAINLIPQQDLRLKLILCIETLNSEGRIGEWKSCMNTGNINPQPILDCYQSRMGIDLELKYGKQTDSLNPPLTYVPWVLVNNHALHENFENFVAYVCKAYTGPNKPLACTQHVLKTNSFKEANSSDRVCYRGVK